MAGLYDRLFYTGFTLTIFYNVIAICLRLQIHIAPLDNYLKIKSITITFALK